MELKEITKVKFIDSGECFEYLKKELHKETLELKKIDAYTFEKSFIVQYDKDDFTLSVSGLISESGRYDNSGGYFGNEWERESITIYDMEINCYLDGEIVQDFEINGIGKVELENVLIDSL